MAMFYNTVIAWAVYYLFLSFNSKLPWRDCRHEWNTRCCFPLNDLRANINPNEIASYERPEYKGKNFSCFIRNGTNERHKLLAVFNTIRRQKSNAFTQANFFEAINEFYLETTNSTLNFNNFTAAMGTAYYYKEAEEPLLNNTQRLINSASEIYTKEIKKWISSYHVLVHNTLLSWPVGNLLNESDYIKSTYIHNPIKLMKKIEDSISEAYSNTNYTVILNCDDFMKSPTHEYYNRFLTEIIHSTGLENLGPLKPELVFCLFLVFITVYFALWKGIKSAGKVRRFTLI
jgi:hypothetical protein